MGGVPPPRVALAEAPVGSVPINIFRLTPSGLAPGNTNINPMLLHNGKFEKTTACCRCSGTRRPHGLIALSSTILVGGKRERWRRPNTPAPPRRKSRSRPPSCRSIPSTGQARRADRPASGRDDPPRGRPSAQGRQSGSRRVDPARAWRRQADQSKKVKSEYSFPLSHQMIRRTLGHTSGSVFPPPKNRNPP